MSICAGNDAAGLTRAGSPERFGYEWNEYSEMRPEYEEQFRRWTAHLRPEDWRGRSFLDVGCGMGRNSYWPLSYGALRGVAIVFDQMLPRIAHYWPREAVAGMMREAGLADVRLTWINEISWTAIGTKPRPRGGQRGGETEGAVAE